MKTYIEFLRRLIIITNWIFFGFLSFVLVGGALNENGRMFYFGLGALAFAFIIHVGTNWIFFKLNSKFLE